MATQLVKMAIKFACVLPGAKYTAPVLGPFILPALWSFLLVPIFLSIMFSSGVTILNRSNDNPEQKSWWKGFKYSFLIYYIIAFMILLFAVKAVCYVSDYIP